MALEVGAVHAVVARPRDAERGAIGEGDVVRTDHATGRGHADHLADPQRLEDVGEHLGVGEGTLVDQHDDRLVPVEGRLRERDGRTTRLHARVRTRRQDLHELLVDVAATVLTHVDDHALDAAAAVPVAHSALEFREVRRVHRTQVDVADAALRGLADLLGVAARHARIAHGSQLVHADGLDALLTGIAGAILGDRAEADAHLLADGAGEELVHVRVAGDLLAVDGDDLVTHAQAGLVRRAAGEDRRDLAALARTDAIGQVEAEVARRGRAGADGIRGTQATVDTEVAGTQLPEHLADHVLELVLVLGVDRHVAVLGPHLLPVDAVHLRVVEALAQAQPGLVEEVGELLAEVDLDLTEEGHLLAVLDRLRGLDAVDLLATTGADREVDVVAARAPAGGRAIARDLHARATRGADHEDAARAAVGRVEHLVAEHRAIGREVGHLQEARAARDATDVAALGVHDEDRLVAFTRGVERDVATVGRVHGIVVTGTVLRELLGRLRLEVDLPDVAVAAALRAEDELRAVRMPVVEEVTLLVLGDLRDLAAVAVHHPDVAVASAGGLEGDPATIGADARPLVLLRTAREATGLAARARRHPDVAVEAEDHHRAVAADVDLRGAVRDGAVRHPTVATITLHDEGQELGLGVLLGEVARVELTPALVDDGLAVPGEAGTVHIVTGEVGHLRALATPSGGRGVEVRDLLLLGDEPEVLAVLVVHGVALVALRVVQALRHATLARDRVEVVVGRALVVVPVDGVEAAGVGHGLAVGRVRAVTTAVARDTTCGTTGDRDLVEVDAVERRVAVRREEDVLPVRCPVTHDLEPAVEREALGFATGHGHEVDVVAAFAHGREGDGLAVRAHARQRVLGLVDRQTTGGRLAIDIGDPDVTPVAEHDRLAVGGQRGVAKAAGVLLGGGSGFGAEPGVGREDAEGRGGDENERRQTRGNEHRVALHGNPDIGGPTLADGPGLPPLPGERKAAPRRAFDRVLRKVPVGVGGGGRSLPPAGA